MFFRFDKEFKDNEQQIYSANVVSQFQFFEGMHVLKYINVIVKPIYNFIDGYKGITSFIVLKNMLLLQICI